MMVNIINGLIVIVLTGGPCAGKTTVLKAILEEFAGLVTVVPEIASFLLNNGFPKPDPWTEEWQDAFERAILPLQVAFETAYGIIAKLKGHRIMVCDRGLMDTAVYLPGGTQQLATVLGIDISLAFARYSAVIHVESLATADPNKYGKQENDGRFEPLERAQSLERATKAVWSQHPTYIFLEGGRGAGRKSDQVIGIIKFMLAGSVSTAEKKV